MGTFLLLLFTLFLAIDFRRTFTVFMVFSIWISHFEFEMPMKISFFNWLSIVSFCIYLFRSSKTWNNWNKFPMWIPFLLMICSSCLSEFFARDERHFPTLITSFFSQFVNVFIFWNVLRERPMKVLAAFYNASIMFAAITVIYAIYETLSESNPFVKMMIQSDIYSNSQIIKDVRYGVHRSQSIFSMHTTNGCACVLLFVFLTTLYRSKVNTLMKGKIVYLLLVSLVIINFTTGSRATIIGMFICSLLFIDSKIIKPGTLGIITVMLLITYMLTADYIQSIVNSIVETKKSLGSNVDMRKDQFDISYYFMMRSPWLGNGNDYVWRYVQQFYRNDILGAESLWFPIMIDRGLIGCVTMLIYIGACCNWLLKKKAFHLLFFVLGITVMNTLSSLPHFTFTYLFVYILAMQEGLELKSKFSYERIIHRYPDLLRRKLYRLNPR